MSIHPTDVDRHNFSGLSGLSTYDAAMLLASRGIPVWLWNARRKVPAISIKNGGHSLNDATTDPEILDAWFKKYGKTCNIATTTGLQPDGTQRITLDIDVPPKHEDGRILVAQWESEGLLLPPTLTTITGTGGRHGHFTTTETRTPLNSTKLGWTGIDIQAEGQSVILPPSKFDGGDRYRFEDDSLPIAPLPEWIAEMLFPPLEIITARASNPLDGLTRSNWNGGPSPAEHFDNTHSWNDVLAPAGWRCTSGDGEAPDSKWQRPGGSSPCSGSILESEWIWIFSTGAGIESDRAYSKFAMHCHFNNLDPRQFAREISLQNKDKTTMRPETKTLTPETVATVADIGERRTVATNRHAELDTIAAACSIQPDNELDALLASCEPQDFADPQLGDLWKLIGEIREEGTVLTYPNLYQRAPHDGKLDRALALLPELFARDAELGALEHAKLVRTNANSRRLTAQTSQIQNMIRDGQNPQKEIERLLDLATPKTGETSLLNILNLNHIPLDPTLPTIGKVEGGPCLLYANSTHDIHGISGIGKSFVGLAIVLQTVRDGQQALIIDFEASASVCLGRLLELGATLAEIDRIGWLHGLKLGDTEMVELTHYAEKLAIILIDTAALAFAAEGLKENEADDIKKYNLEKLYPLAAVGPAVLTIDHVSDKARDRTDQDGARGSTAKKAAITGASYILKGKGFGRKRKGDLTLKIVKDRHGHVGEVGETASRIVVTPECELTGDRFTFQFSKPAPSIDAQGNFRPSGIMQKIYEWATEHAGEFKATDLRAKNGDGEPIIRGATAHLNTARDCLISEGYLLKRTDPKGTIFYRLDPLKERFSE